MPCLQFRDAYFVYKAYLCKWPLEQVLYCMLVVEIIFHVHYLRHLKEVLLTCGKLTKDYPSVYFISACTH